jgi:hypothetical protein
VRGIFLRDELMRATESGKVNNDNLEHDENSYRLKNVYLSPSNLSGLINANDRLEQTIV